MTVSPSGGSSAKADLRARCRAYREGLDGEAYARASAHITEACLALAEVRQARTVHAYWPLNRRREVDTRLLIEQLQALKVRVVLPVVVERPGPGRPPRMEHRTFTGIGALRPGPWGTLEPSDAPLVPPTAIDVVLVPTLAADRDGNRIGYGAGFYDAFLAATPAVRVGLVYAACLHPSVPAEPHDAPLDVVVTEREVIRPTQPRTRNLPPRRA